MAVTGRGTETVKNVNNVQMIYEYTQAYKTCVI